VVTGKVNEASVKLIGSTYEPSAKGRYHLSIGLSDRSVSFAVLDVAQKQFVALFERTAIDPNALGKTLSEGSEKDLSLLEPISVSAFIKGEASTLVPSGSFIEAHAHQHLAITQSADLNVGVLHETIPSLDVEMLYAQDPEKSDALMKSFPQAKCFDARTVFLNGIARRSAANDIQSLHLHVWENEMDIALFEKGNLLLFNSHYFSSAEDVLYHCIFALDRAEIDRNKIEVQISGAVEDGGDLSILLSKYFTTPILMEGPDLLKRTTELVDRPYHLDHLLYELYQCAL